MKISVTLSGVGFLFGGDLGAVVEMARMADDLGVSQLVVTDHVVMGPHTERYPYGRFPMPAEEPWPEPMVLLAAMAQATRRIRLGTGILIAPLRPPLLLAKTAATLDALSGGRLDLGVGVGWQREEFAAGVAPFEERWRSLDEGLRACRALWSEDPSGFCWRGERFSALRAFPKPVQEGGIPVWFGVAASPRQARRMAELGDGWMPMASDPGEIRAGLGLIREALAAAGRDADAFGVRAHAPLVLEPKGRPDLERTLADLPALHEAGATVASFALAAFCREPAQVRAFLERLGREARASDAAHPRPDPSPPPGPGAPGGYAWYVLFILFAAYVFNFADRQLLPLALEQIKQEMELSDTLLGLLLGFAFTMFYTLAGIPIAALADRGNRRSIVALGLLVWSSMTAACGLAQNALHLALARFGVGIGEAAGTPPSHSLISDYFPAERRATAMSVYAMGIYGGVLFGFVGGGYLIQWLSWRGAFVTLGLLGIPLALLLRLTVREPIRGASDARPGAEPAQARSMLAGIRLLAANRTFGWLTLGACFQALAGYAILSWGPAFLIRVHHMAPSELGLGFGVIAGIGGAAGATLGGVLSDRLSARDPRWAMGLPALISLLAAPFAVPFLLAEDRTTALSCFALYYFVNNMYVGPLWSVAQGLVEVRMRALASASLLTVLNLVGLGAGPLLVGLMNDQLAPVHGEAAIRYSLLVMTLAGAVSAVFFFVCARRLGRDTA